VSRDTVAAVSRDLLARTVALLLSKDSKSSFTIEGEHPPQDRIQYRARTVGLAGRQPINLDELLRSQRIVIDRSKRIKRCSADRWQVASSCPCLFIV
jgi:hypothetical protein